MLLVMLFCPWRASSRLNRRRITRRSPFSSVARPFSSDADGNIDVDLGRLDRNGEESTSAPFVSSIIRRCSNVWQTKRVHRHILSSPRLSSDRLLLNLLIQSYGKFGCVEDARTVFERILHRNVFSWTMIMAAYAHNGHTPEALQLFNQMLLDGAKPDEVGFLTSLESCSPLSSTSSFSSSSASDSLAYRSAKRIHELILDAGLESVTFLANAVANLYGRCGRLEEAAMVFERIPRKDVVSWNTMLTVYARARHGERVLELFHRMLDDEGRGGEPLVKPDRVTYLCVLEACCFVDESLEQGRAIHSRIVADGFDTDLAIMNTLVSTYGDCGAVDEARSVFDRMEQRDVVSWNAIIRVYAQRGQRKSALEMFRRMQLERLVAPNEITFVSVLGATAGDEMELREVQDSAAEAGFDSSNVFVGNSLVHLHGKRGKVADARQLFDTMASQSVSSWNSIVDVYAHNGLDDEAFGLFRWMQHEGVRPDKVTYLSVLEGCSSLILARHVRDLVASAGLGSDVLLQTALLQTFARNSSILDAKYVFDGIRYKDLFAWNSLLTAYAQSGAGEDALETFYRMNQEGVKANEQTFVSVIDSCATIADLENGVRAHKCAVECGVIAAVSVGNTLINMYGNCRSLEQAKLVFDTMEEKNLVTWNALVQHAPGDTALELLGSMQLQGTKPDKVTFFACLDACSTDLDQVRMVHGQISSARLDSEVALANSLINTYRKCRSLEHCKLVFDSFEDHRDVVSWTSMLCACVETGCHDEAFELWYRMLQHGDRPDSVTFSGILDACSGLASMRHSQMILEQVRSSGQESSATVVPALLGMLSKCFSLEQAVETFERAEVKNVALYNSIIAALSQHGHVKKSLRLFQSMDLEGVGFNRATVNAILDACAGHTGLAQARIVHKSIADSGFLSDVIIDNTLINMYGKCGSFREARRVFNSMQGRELVSWNTIVTVAAQNGDVVEARKLFQGLQQEGLKPDNVALMSVASVCQHAGILEEAFYYLFQLAKEYGVKPTRERYSCIIGLLGRIGWLEEAEAMIRKMPFQPNEAVWKNLLMSCKIHKDVARGARVAKELLGLNSADSATYVTLHNMYVEVDEELKGNGDLSSQNEEGLTEETFVP